MIRTKEEVSVREVTNAMGGKGTICFHDWLLPEELMTTEDCSANWLFLQDAQLEYILTEMNLRHFMFLREQQL